MPERMMIQVGAVAVIGLLAGTVWFMSPGPRDSQARPSLATMPPELPAPLGGSAGPTGPTAAMPGDPAMVDAALAELDAALAEAQLAALEEQVHVESVYALFGASSEDGPIEVEGFTGETGVMSGRIAGILDAVVVFDGVDEVFRDEDRVVAIAAGHVRNAVGSSVPTRFVVHRYLGDAAEDHIAFIEPAGDRGVARAAAGWLADAGKPFDHRNARNRSPRQLKAEAERLSRRCAAIRGDTCRHRLARGLCDCEVGFLLDVAGLVESHHAELNLIYVTAKRRGVGIGLAATLEITICVAELVASGEDELAAFGACLIQVFVLAGIGDGINDRELRDALAAEMRRFNDAYDALVRKNAECRRDVKNRNPCEPGKPGGEPAGVVVEKRLIGP